MGDKTKLVKLVGVEETIAGAGASDVRDEAEAAVIADGACGDAELCGSLFDSEKFGFGVFACGVLRDFDV